MSKKKKLIVVCLIISMLSVAGIAGFLIYDKVEAEAQQKLSTFNKLMLIFRIVEGNYVEESDPDKLLTGAIKGMLKSLDDPYTGYLPPQQYKNMQEDFNGKYGGIGIVITMKEEQLTIVSPIKDTPGDRAGLEAGDMIMAVDSNPTAEMTMSRAVELMKGEPDTEVVLTIKRKLDNDNEDAKDKFKEFKVDIIREEIELSYVDSELKESKIGYIHLAQFINGVGENISKEIENLHKQGAQAFILDLRNNPGGLLPEASKVASNFIDQGPVVYVKERNGKKEAYPLADEIKTIDQPLIILVNGGSASASEIVTGAVQDNQRGTVIGEQTFGKGVVQSVVPLQDGSALRLTTARYYTPKGRFIHHEGIKPDLIVKNDSEKDGDEQLEKAIEILKDKYLN